MNMDKIFTVAVVGPTASGKTELAINISRALDGEIISADSMQIYRGMDIATAMPTSYEQSQAKHHFINFLDVNESFSVAQYKHMADSVAHDIASRGKIPVICGGTGLYINTLLENIELFEQASDMKVREKLVKEAHDYGIEKLFERLRKIDSDSANRLHINDEKRIIRALEVYESTGMTISEQLTRSRLNPSAYDVCYIGITAERQYLYDRIDRRVDLMLENGLIEEAKRFYSRHDYVTAAQAIGYKELKPYLDGECTLKEASDRLKMQTRRYAKRQLTWFRKNENINWLYSDKLTKEEMLSEALRIIADRKGRVCTDEQ